MAVVDRNKRGEKLLYRSVVTRNDNTNLDYSDMLTVVVDIKDTAGVGYQKTKAAAEVVEGTVTNEIEFELSDTETAYLGAGNITLTFTVTYTDAQFSSNTAKKVWDDSFELNS